jgi:tRNA A37 threonylcarbamoyladenosine dehydratase
MIPERFKRTALLIGDHAYKRLASSHVTVVGLGAVGYHAAEAMVRYGIGGIRLVDFDVIRESNINRQLLALDSTTGMAKAAAARQRLLDINPNLKVETHESFLHHDTFHQLFRRPTDLVVDAIDSFSPKLTLVSLLMRQQIPLVSSMGAALRTDPLAVTVDDIWETKVCPLAGRMRKFLRRQGVQGHFPCVYSTETPAHALVPPEQEEDEPFYDRGRQRNTIGSISYITGIFGYIAASEALKSLLAHEYQEKNKSNEVFNQQ